MRPLVLLLLAAFARPAPAQQPQRVIFVPSDPSGVCSVVAALRYNTLNGSLWGCNNGTWATTNGTGSMTWPAAAGIAVYAGGSAWGTSLTAPTGALVGTTDTQSLTNKTVDGVTPTTFGFLDPTSSVQTQLGNRVVSGAPNAQAATYQVLAADFSSFKTITVASGTFTVTLVASGSQPASGQYIRVVNYGSGVVTIARSGQNINGGVTSLTLGAASATSPTSAFIISDGTNYFGSTAGTTAAVASSNITSGTYSSLPGTCAHSSTASDAYWTTDSYYSFLCTATNTFTPFLDGKQATLPTAASTWTVVSGASGTAAKADSNGAVTLSSAAAVVGVEALLKAVPAAPYTKTLAIRFYGSPGTSGSGNIFTCGVMWSAGVTTSSAIEIVKLATSQTQGGIPYTETGTYTNFTYSGGALVGVDYTYTLGSGPSSTIWFQLIDNNTNRSAKLSNDGVNWVQIMPAITRTSPFTPTHYGVFCGAQSGVAATQPFNLTLLSDN